MKKVWLFILLLTGIAATSRAQNIILGERVPELRVSAWLHDSAPAAAPLTYIEFFHTSAGTGCASLEHLQKISNKLGTKLRVIVVAREPEEKIAPLLTPFLSPRLGVALDPSGRTFTAFGVSYVPFGVLTDSKNRALWMGNTMQLTPQTIEKTSK